jgi:hypothetical protein
VNKTLYKKAERDNFPLSFFIVSHIIILKTIPITLLIDMLNYVLFAFSIFASSSQQAKNMGKQKVYEMLS